MPHLTQGTEVLLRVSQGKIHLPQGQPPEEMSSKGQVRLATAYTEGAQQQLNPLATVRELFSKERELAQPEAETPEPTLL